MAQMMDIEVRIEDESKEILNRLIAVLDKISATEDGKVIADAVRELMIRLESISIPKKDV